jgi:hypothetical protein
MREIPIVVRSIEPHPGTEKLSLCLLCQLENRYVQVRVIVETIYEEGLTFKRGLCAHHTELLEEIPATTA